MDGVLADMDGQLASLTASLFGQAISRPPTGTASGAIVAAEAPADEAASTSRATASNDGNPQARAQPSSLTARQQRRLWRHIQTVEDFWVSLKEIEPGSVARLGAVAAARQWEVIFLTKRPASGGATAQVQTQRWLEAHGFVLPSVYVVQGSRGRIAAALDLDVVVDDRPENCLDVVLDSKARAILVWREDQGPLPADAKRLSIGVVKSVTECLDILAHGDVPPQKSKLMARVMRLLGLKEPA